MSGGGGVGVLGVGASLPAEVRQNDWWPSDVVARWTELSMARVASLRRAGPPVSEGAALVHDAIVNLGGDPFGGSRERRIMAADETSYDLEASAARDALVRAAVDPGEIDLLLTQTAVPEYLVQNGACILHRRLGLSTHCITMQVDATAYSAMAQVAVAEALLARGTCRRALLVQSCGASRLLADQSPLAPLFGDGATAMVLGAVSPGFGVLASTHRTDSRWPLSLVASGAQASWYGDERSRLHVPDPGAAHQVFLAIPDQGREVIDAVLTAAGVRHADVAFFATHQGTSWLRPLVQRYVGLGAARSLDTFPTAGSLFGCNVPLVLRSAEDAGLIAPGDLVMLFGGGTGATYGAALLRWGR